jgi:hypothetical protein
MPKHHFSIEYDVRCFPFTNLLLPSTNTYLGSYVHTYVQKKGYLPFPQRAAKNFHQVHPKSSKISTEEGEEEEE